jgi:hypothetical protein
LPYVASTKAALLASTSTYAISSSGYPRWHLNQSILAEWLPSSPLGSILDDIRRAIEARLYYPALAVALTVPEICVGLTRVNSVFVTKNDYVSFVDKYTAERDLGMDGLACYQLRGGVIHRGNAAGHPFFGSTHVVFCLPESPSSMHALSIDTGSKKAAMIELVTFCRTMVRAAEAWYEDHRENESVIANMPALLSYRANGISPFIVGIPVIASGPPG